MAPIDWQEVLHPRGEGGKFRTKEELAEAAREVGKRDRDRQQEQTSRWSQVRVGKIPKDAEGRTRIPGGRPWIEHDPAFPHGQTWHAYWEKGPDGEPIDPNSGGEPTRERAETVHKPILDKAFEKATPTPAGAPKYAVLTMGAPASGKSSVIRGVVPEDGWVKIDPDAVKEQLPEYQHAIAASAEDAATMVHEESSYVAKKIRERAIAEGYPIMVDGTGADVKKFGNLIDRLHNEGYHVRVVMADLDKDEGIKRLLKRAEATGRLPPPDWAAKAYDTIPGNFEEIARKADGFRLVSTRSTTPEVVWSKDERGETVHNEERVAEFKARAHSQRLAASARKKSA